MRSESVVGLDKLTRIQQRDKEMENTKEQLTYMYDRARRTNNVLKRRARRTREGQQAKGYG